MGFSRQEYWSGLLPAPPGDLPDPEMEHMSSTWQVDSLLLALPGASLVAQLEKNLACNMGDLGLIPGLGRSPGEGKGYPLHYSGLENSMDCIVHEIAKSQTQLSDFHTQDHLGSPIWPMKSESSISHSVMSDSFRPHGL